MQNFRRGKSTLKDKQRNRNKVSRAGEGGRGGLQAQRVSPGYIDPTFEGPLSSFKLLKMYNNYKKKVFLVVLADKTFLFNLHVDFRLLCKIQFVFTHV